MGKVTHGMTGTPTRNCWLNMIQRCTNEKHPSYHRYGGRGITVCEEWLTFENFFRDMGTKPDDLTLDRIDNNGNYCKINCRWATRLEQKLNQNPYLMSNPRKGVTWKVDETHKAGGLWRAYSNKPHKGRQVTLYAGPSLKIAIEAREFYEEFFGVK
jgi:hypothetical protein